MRPIYSAVVTLLIGICLLGCKSSRPLTDIEEYSDHAQFRLLGDAAVRAVSSPRHQELVAAAVSGRWGGFGLDWNTSVNYGSRTLVSGNFPTTQAVPDLSMESGFVFSGTNEEDALDVTADQASWTIAVPNQPEATLIGTFDAGTADAIVAHLFKLPTGQQTVTRDPATLTVHWHLGGHIDGQAVSEDYDQILFVEKIGYYQPI